MRLHVFSPFVRCCRVAALPRDTERTTTSPIRFAITAPDVVDLQFPAFRLPPAFQRRPHTRDKPRELPVNLSRVQPALVLRRRHGTAQRRDLPRCEVVTAVADEEMEAFHDGVGITERRRQTRRIAKRRVFARIAVRFRISNEFERQRAPSCRRPGHRARGLSSGSSGQTRF